MYTIAQIKSEYARKNWFGKIMFTPLWIFGWIILPVIFVAMAVSFAIEFLGDKEPPHPVKGREEG